ncbi:MAG TPA: isopentenyl-diphosphate Delta-isomerase [Flavobacteriales bacterium]|jgi:isopentenyl-diphosphate delta-isomerase|nr:isopentenyl-diphosphate Delta-isomerase [Flavobacteriales bacterium]
MTDRGTIPGANDVVLVDAQDTPIGTMDKLEAHKQGLLHRAFSVFVLDTGGRILLQQRALGKYHSGGLWTNTCCSHPRPEEAVRTAAARRLREEMGLACALREGFQFTYRAEVGNGLTEHEFDHVFFGHTDNDPKPNPAEVMDTRWATPQAITAELATDPWRFTAWFRICWPEVLAHLQRQP